jgi:hypothetical protein
MRPGSLARSLLVLLGVLGAGGPAAADMFSPFFIADDGETAVCHILNLSSKPVVVEIQVRYYTGVVAEAESVTADPHELRQVTFDGANSTRFYCAFLGKVSPKSVRAAGEVEAGGRTKLVVPAQ